MQGELLAGRFRIRERVGVGGMGEVWAAQDERMRREVAVKLVHALPFMSEAETQARFEREVQLAGRLSHPNIVTVHDWGDVEVGGRRTLYFVMELVPGVSLRERLKESTPPWPRAVGWAAQIAHALHAASLEGVVHRDIKPANVLITPDGTAKVLDFGVAKIIGDTLNAYELTATGAVLGSPPYMSPEQAGGQREIDHRSDLYSLGCLLYHAVTGRPPFIGENQLAVLRMQMDDLPVEPGTHVKELPSLLNDLIMSLLAKSPEHRPQQATAVYNALCTVLVDHALTSADGNFLDVAVPGLAGGLAGRMLRETWQRAKVHLGISEAEAYRILDEAHAEAERLREVAAKERAEAESLLDGARTEAAAIRAEVGVGAEAQQQVRAFEDHDEGQPRVLSVFQLVRRGYDPGQVDDDIAKLVSDRDAALAHADLLEREIANMSFGADRLIDRTHASVERELLERQIPAPQASDTSPFAFQLVRRGYDRGQVDEHIAQLVSERHRARALVAALKEVHADLDMPAQE